MAVSRGFPGAVQAARVRPKLALTRDKAPAGKPQWH
jgi:hypothetical protein